MSIYNIANLAEPWSVQRSRLTRGGYFHHNHTSCVPGRLLQRQRQRVGKQSGLKYSAGKRNIRPKLPSCQANANFLLVFVADSILMLHTPVPVIQARPRPARCIIGLRRSRVNDRCQSTSQWLLALTIHFQRMRIATQVLNGKTYRRWRLVKAPSVSSPEQTYWLCTIYKHKRRHTKPYSLGSKKTSVSVLHVSDEKPRFPVPVQFWYSTSYAALICSLLSGPLWAFIVSCGLLSFPRSV